MNLFFIIFDIIIYDVNFAVFSFILWLSALNHYSQKGNEFKALFYLSNIG